MNGITLGAGGLIALDRNDRRVLVLIERAMELATFSIDAAARHRPGAPLNGLDATAVGILLARTRTSDVVDAHVAICAQRTGQMVITSDPGDLRRLAPELEFLVV